MPALGRIRRLPSDLGRAVRILAVLAPVAMAFVRVGRGKQAQEDLPGMVRRAFEELGPSFVKLGQILSVRPDIVPADYVAEFEKLQSAVGTVSSEQVREVVTAALGAPPDRLFAAFQPEPIAGASVAQVHKAVLTTGQVVAVKVQRPRVAETFAQDIRLLRSTAAFAERFAALRNYRPRQLVEEFADWTGRELDFRVEGHNADHFRFDFADDPTVYVPTIYWDHTARQVLTMEFVEGVSVEDSEALDRLGTDRAELARRGIRVLLKQVFVDRFFHGDPHPGNMFVLPDEVVCYHDFGIVGRLSEEVGRELTSFLIAFSRKDVDSAVRHLTHLSMPLPGADPERMKRDFGQLVGAWIYTGRQSIAATFQQILQLGAANAMAFPTELALLGKALITVETVGYALDPDFDMDGELERFLPDLFRAMLEPSRLATVALSSVLDYAHWLTAAPEQLSHVLDAFSAGRLSLGVDRRELGALLAEMRRTTLIRTLAPVIAVLLVGGLLVYGRPLPAVAGVSATVALVGVAVVLSLWLVWLLFSHPAE